MSEEQGYAGELSSQQKLADLVARGSNTQTVESIETTGHTASATVTAAAIGYGAVSAAGSGGIAAVACFAAPLAAGIAGAVAGAALANHLALDEKLLDFLGKPKLAAPGPQPATVGHEIAHSSPFAGALGGLLAAVAVGALCAVAVAAVVGTGGLAAGVLIGAAAGMGGGFAGSLVNGFFSKQGTVTGQIVQGSPDVFFEGKPVARVTDKISCSQHSIPPQIAEGSNVVSVNGLPLARIGHKTTCGATIQGGCKTVFADDTTGQYGPIDSQMSVAEQTIVSLAEVALCFSAVRFRSSKMGKNLFGEPIDPSDGGFVDFRTDFEYPSVLPLVLTRTYTGKDKTQGLLGNKWLCNWSQRLIYDCKNRTADFEAADGELLQYDLGKAETFSSRNLKSPHYHLTGTKDEARLFDTRIQQTLVFTTTEDKPNIGRLVAIEDRNQNRIDFLYEGQHLRRVTHSDGVSFIVATTPESYLENVFMEDGFHRDTLVSYTYTPAGEIKDVLSLFGGEFHYTYTKEGWLNAWRDSGQTKVDIEYDSQGKVIATHTPDGTYNDRFAYFPEEKKTEYHDAAGGITIHWFNQNNLLIKEQDPLGNITTHEIDGLDRKRSTTDPLGRTVTYDYDPYGNLTAETGWTGKMTKLTYNKQGLITKIDYPDGSKATWTYDDCGNILEAGEPDGGTWFLTYDNHGRLIGETAPDGRSTRLDYDCRGRLSSFRNALGHTTHYHTDRFGRLTEITDPEGRVTRYQYDITPDNLRGDVSKITYPDGGEESFTYDREGLPQSHKAPEGQTTKYQHGAFDLLRSITDPKGCATTLDYDKASRLKSITNAAGQTWAYGYNLAGQLTTETDWAGRQTLYRRDAAGRVITKRFPDQTGQTLSWDEEDRIIAVDTQNRRIAYEYDDKDRLIRAVTWNKGNERTDLETDLSFAYDSKGRLVKEIQNGTLIEYKYDTAGRLLSRISPTGKTTHTYDILGQHQETGSNGHTLAFTRNALGLETQRQYQSAANPAEGKDDRSLVNAFALKQSYDPCGRLKTQEAGSFPAVKSTSPHERMAQMTRRYNCDKSGRLVGVKDNKRGASAYLYDRRDQINQVIHTFGLNKQKEERYTYDVLMNISSNDGFNSTYENGEVKTAGQNSYKYDTRGRVIEKKQNKPGFRPQIWRYGWDDFDRMTNTRTPDGAVWQYTYDAFGRRVKKECINPGRNGQRSSITYIWQGATLAEEWRTVKISSPSMAGAGEGATTETTSDIPTFLKVGRGDFKTDITRWHFEPGTFYPIAKETNGSFYPIVTDHLGTPKELFDRAGNCLWQAEQALWGRSKVVWSENQPEKALPIVDCSLRFQNQWEDKETGLYYNLQRYYDPDSGQYLSQDPIGLEGGLRTHGYVHDPMQWVDPMGLAGCGTKKAIVIGEGMGRIKTAAKDLRTKGINAKWYQAWGKNFPKNRQMTQSELDAAIARNERWINMKMKQGYEIYDLGIDPTRARRSPFYGVETQQIAQNRYSTIPLNGY